MKVINKNKKCYFEYHILKEYIAGIKLVGSEIKPIRNNKISIGETYCYIKDGEVFLKGMHVSDSDNNHWSHNPTRDRKLLLNKREIIQIEKELDQKGNTLVLLAIGLNSHGLIKAKIAVAKGKKLYDKRASLREKDLDRQVKRDSKY